MLVSSALPEHSAALGFGTRPNGPLRPQANAFSLLPDKPWSVSALRVRPRDRVSAAVSLGVDAKRRHASPSRQSAGRLHVNPSSTPLPVALQNSSQSASSECPALGSDDISPEDPLVPFDYCCSPQKRVRLSDEHSDENDNGAHSTRLVQATTPYLQCVQHTTSVLVARTLATDSNSELDQSVRIISLVPPLPEFCDSLSKEPTGSPIVVSKPQRPTGDNFTVSAHYTELSHSPLLVPIAAPPLPSGAMYASPPAVTTVCGQKRRSLDLRLRIVTNPFYRRRSASPSASAAQSRFSQAAECESIPTLPSRVCVSACASHQSAGDPGGGGASEAHAAPVATSVQHSCRVHDTLSTQTNQAVKDPLSHYCTPRELLDSSQQVGYYESVDIAQEMCRGGAGSPPPTSVFESSASYLSPSNVAFVGGSDRRPSLESTPMQQRRRSPSPATDASRDASGASRGRIALQFESEFERTEGTAVEGEGERETEPESVYTYGPMQARLSAAAEGSSTNRSTGESSALERIKRTARRSLQSLLQRSSSFRAAKGTGNMEGTPTQTPKSVQCPLDEDAGAGASGSQSAVYKTPPRQPKQNASRQSARAEKQMRRRSGLPDEEHCTLTALTRCSSPVAEAAAPPELLISQQLQQVQQAVIVPIASKKRRRLVDLVFRK